MIVNYDKENGFSTIFSKLGGGAKPSSDFTKAISEIGKMSISSQPALWKSWGQEMGYTDSRLLKFLGDVDAGKKSIGQLSTVVNTTTKSTSKFATILDAGKGLLGNFISTIGNMAMGMAAGAVISKAISLVDDYIHRNEILIETGEEAKSSIDDTFSAFSDGKSSIMDLGKSLSDNADDITTAGDAIDSIAEKYTKLRDGVNWSDNSNKFLSDDDYQSYLDISNQIADQFPSLVSGYDAQGNAILNLGNNASTAASQLTELYNASMLSANVDIGNQLNDHYSGVEAQIKEYQNQINDWQNVIDKNDEKIASIDLEPTDITDGIIEFDPNAFGKETTKVRKEITDILKKHGITNREDVLEDGTIQINTSGINDATAQEIKDVIDTYGEDAINALTIDNAEYEQKIAANKQLMQDQWDSMADALGQYIQTSPAFSELDSTLQNAFLGNIREIDASVIGEEYDGDVQQFIYSEILNPLSEMKPEAQQALADLIQFDSSNINIDEYSDLISKALYNAFPNDSELQNQMRKTFGFDKAIEEAEHQADALKNTLGEGFSDAIDAMSLDELEKGYDIVINGDEAISTVDELQEKIKQAQALAATSVDLNIHTAMDAMDAAAESENAGADYEKAYSYAEKAKELFDKGLIGTDDFKSFASYISPTGADDAVNYAENIGKAMRYLTEDGQGVQNFLKDLESKGLASMETLSDGTQQWTYDIKDLEDASQKMGIGFEFMMDMFGRLEDYGAHNNFVGSVEDGAQRITDLTAQIAQEEAKLADLESKGQYKTIDENGNVQYTKGNQTAIDQQREKIQGLRNDILETQEAMDQLVQHSAADYAEQIDSAEQQISALRNEYEELTTTDTDKYGKNTALVAEKLKEQIQSIADEYGFELDAELNITNTDEALDVGDLDLDIDLSKTDELKDAAQEYVGSVQDMVSEISTVKIDLDSDDLYDIDSQINAVQEVLYGLRNEDGTIDIETEGVQEAINVLNGLYAQKAAVSGSIIMSIDTSALDSDVGIVISKLQEFHNAYSELERLNTLSSAGISVDTSEAQANLDSIFSKIQGLDGQQAEIMAKLVPDTSSIESIESSITGLTSSDLSTKVGVQVTGKQDVDNLKSSIDNVPKSTNVTVSAMTYGKANVDDLADSISNVNSKSVTITATTVKKTVTESEASGTMLSVAHASGTAYNVLNLKPAYAKGSVALPRDEKALVNEIDTESIIRDGVWSLLPGGMHIESLKKGDIILNANQTKALLQYGKAPGHARAYAGGSLLASYARGSGGVSFFVGGSGSSSGMSGRPSNSSKKSSAEKSADKASKSAEKAADKFEEIVDSIEILLDRMNRSIQKLTDSIETYSYDLSKQSAMSDKAMSTIRSNLTTLQSAYNRYIKEANSVGLSSSWKKRVQNGAIDITTVNNEDLADQISKYQDWWKISRQCKIFLMLGTP